MGRRVQRGNQKGLGREVVRPRSPILVVKDELLAGDFLLYSRIILRQRAEWINYILSFGPDRMRQFFQN